METAFKIEGVKFTKDTIQELSVQLGRDVVSLGRQEARALAVELGRVTPPVGLRANDGRKLKLLVRDEIAAMFPTLQDGQFGAVKVYSLLEKTDKKMAEAFWVAWKAQDAAEVDRLLTQRVRGLPKGLKKGAYEQARKKPGGVRSRSPISLVRKGQRANFVKQKQRKVGLGKKGWLKAARSLGGRVRRGGGRSGGTTETFPNWVRKARGSGMLGEARIRKGRNGVRISLINHVTHVERSLSFKLQLQAERGASRNYRIALENARKFRQQKINKKLRRVA